MTEKWQGPKIGVCLMWVSVLRGLTVKIRLQLLLIEISKKDNARSVGLLRVEGNSTKSHERRSPMLRKSVIHKLSI